MNDMVTRRSRPKALFCYHKKPSKAILDDHVNNKIPMITLFLFIILGLQIVLIEAETLTSVGAASEDEKIRPPTTNDTFSTNDNDQNIDRKKEDDTLMEENETSKSKSKYAIDLPSMTAVNKYRNQPTDADVHNHPDDDHPDGGTVRCFQCEGHGCKGTICRGQYCALRSTINFDGSVNVWKQCSEAGSSGCVRTIWEGKEGISCLCQDRDFCNSANNHQFHLHKIITLSSPGVLLVIAYNLIVFKYLLLCP